MRKTLFIVTVMSLLSQGNYAQNTPQQKIDSLLIKLGNSKEDSNKVSVYCDIMLQYVYYKSAEGLTYEQPALALAEKLNWTFGIAKVKDRAGRIRWRLGKFDDALKNHFTAYKLYSQEGRISEAVYVLVSIGQDYLDNSKYPEAETWLLKAVKAAKENDLKVQLADAYDKLIYLYYIQGNFAEGTKTSYKYLAVVEEIGTDLGRIAHGHYMLGMNSKEMGNSADAIKHFKLGLQMAAQTGRKPLEAGFHNSLSEAYLESGNLAEALKYNTTALEIAKEIKDMPFLAATYSGRGNVYVSLGDSKKAIENYLLAESLFKKLDSKPDLALLYASMGTCYTRLKNYNEAKKIFDKAGMLYTEIGSNQHSKIGYYNGLRSLDSATGNWKSAYEHYGQYVALKDSSFNRESLKKMVASQMQFESDKKDAIAKATQEKKDLLVQGKITRQRNILISAFAMLAMVLLFSVVVFRQRNKIAKEKQRSDLLLQDKELLLKEIHHRVKNNLEIVSSLLALQSAQIDDQNTKDAMLEGQNRVQSIGIVHQKLYHGTNLGAIEMKDYFINLGESIIDSFGAEKRVTIECNMNELDVDIDTAVPLGLIVNELLTNTLKYAFPSGQNGKVLIKLEKRNDGVLQLEISDNGVGKSGVTHGSGFGGQLVSLLTQQLSGSMREEIKDGTHIYFEFRTGKAA
jgi:two-component sensor histidine kinase